MTNNNSAYTTGVAGQPSHNHRLPSHVHGQPVDQSNPVHGHWKQWTDDDVDRMVKSAVAEAVAWHTAEIEELKQAIDDLEVELEVSNNDFGKSFKSSWTKDRRGDRIPPPIQLPKHRGLI